MVKVVSRLHGILFMINEVDIITGKLQLLHRKCDIRLSNLNSKASDINFGDGF